MNIKRNGITSSSLLCCLLFSALPAMAANVMFGENENQILISAGQSIRNDIKDPKTENLYIASLSYGIPTNYFGAQGRFNFEAGVFQGKNARDNQSVGSPGYPKTTDLEQYNLGYAGFSQDIAIIRFGGFYTSLGLGAYMKTKATNRIGTAFTFGEKAALGYNFGPVAVEAYIRHFSNAGLSEQNSGQNFYGAAVAYNF